MKKSDPTFTYLGQPIGMPGYVPRETAWLRHGPFAQWLVCAARPGTIVELGTHFGFSYFSFCEAIKRNSINACCYAVDTWQGDEHAGHYGEEVYESVEKQNIAYRSFSTLLRKTFSEALADIPDGSVDLLHIDGRHFYADVKEDFETWIPKLSKRAIVLFHDTEVRNRGFGVYKYWEELTAKYAFLNFPYQHGLGVLFVGTDFTPEIQNIIKKCSFPSGRAEVVNLFSLAGEYFILSARRVFK